MSITIDGVRLSDLGVRVLQATQHPVLPGTRDKSIVIPGRHGAYDFGAELDVRQFEIPCLIERQPTHSDLQRKVRELARLFIDQYGRPKTIKLVFDEEPDKFYNARYSGSVPIDRIVRMGKFVLPLTAYNPFAKFIVPSDEIIMDSDVPILSDITLDAVYTFQITKPDQMIQVINDGNIAVRPTILINGTTSRLSIQNTDTNQSFYIDNINQPVEVNGENYTVKIGGVSSLSALHGDFIDLLPGYNNIHVDPSGSIVQLTFRFYHQYM